MKFNRNALIEAVGHRIIATHEAARKEYDEQVREYDQAVMDWERSDHRKYFIDEADKLMTKAGDDLVTYDDLKPFQSRWNDGPARRHVFNRSIPEYRKPNTTVLDDLLSFLKSVTDDEISSSGLRDVGFRNIANILRSTN